MINFDKIQADFTDLYGKVPGVINIEVNQNLLRVLLTADNIVEEENLPATYFCEAQMYEIGIEYDSLPRKTARELYAQKEAAAKALLEAVQD